MADDALADPVASPVVDVVPDETVDGEPTDAGDEQVSTPTARNQTSARNIAATSTAPAEDVLTFDWPSFSSSGDLWLSFSNQTEPLMLPAPGSTIQVHYDPNLVTLSDGDQSLVVYYSGPDQTDVWIDGEIPVASIDVNAVAGVITFTFSENAAFSGWYDSWYFAEIEYSLNQTCDPASSAYEIPSQEIEFSSSTGDVHSAYTPPVSCNVELATKDGSWVVDGEVAEWSIDSGEHLGYGNVSDYVPAGMAFDCDTLVVTPYPGTTVSDEISCDPDYFEVYFDSGNEGIARVTITVQSTVVEGEEQTSYLNCADARSYGNHSAEPISVLATQRIGNDRACYELFPSGGGDELTKVVDKETANAGDSLTYTITGTTTSDRWGTITITDVVPAGIAVDAVTCSVEPVMFMADPCYMQTGDSLSVVATASEENPAAPVTITVVIEGTVIAEAGSEIVNEACYERVASFGYGGGGHGGGYGGYSLQPLAIGDPTIPGGGVICESVVTNVPGLEPTPTTPVDPTPTPTTPVDPTETPDPTVEPTTPVEPTAPATPGASPTAPVDPDPTATSPVTGLPETGNAGASASGVAMMFGAVAGVLLLVGAVGMRLRPRN